jgi:polar amino acid transport system ATP-binding protein
MLIIKNLSKKFHEKTILKHINLDVAPSTIAVLLGHSGVGKSTLLRVLNNLEKPDSDEISFNNKTLDLNTVNQQHTIGMIFQQFNIFEHLTVEQNITLALIHVMGKTKRDAKKIAHELLEYYDLATLAHAYPNQLSGGQKQRLAIARALALKPKILCADEPTSALDPLLTNHVAHTFQELARQGLIIIIASHDVALVQALECTIYLMEHGTIVESGSSKDVQKNPAQFPKIAAFMMGKK